MRSKAESSRVCGALLATVTIEGGDYCAYGNFEDRQAVSVSREFAGLPVRSIRSATKPFDGNHKILYVILLGHRMVLLRGA
jgi:hypothetical protein